MCENSASRGQGRMRSGRSRLHACSRTRRHQGEPSYSYRISLGFGGGAFRIAATAPRPPRSHTAVLAPASASWMRIARACKLQAPAMRQHKVPRTAVAACCNTPKASRASIRAQAVHWPSSTPSWQGRLLPKRTVVA